MSPSLQLEELIPYLRPEAGESLGLLGIRLEDVNTPEGRARLQVEKYSSTEMQQ